MGHPTFLTVQTLSFIVIGAVIWLLWFLLFAFPVDVRGTFYWLMIDTGLLGPNAVYPIYGLLSLITLQQFFKAFLGVPLSTEVEPADIDFLFTAPIRINGFLLAKYLRSIPRRIQFLFYLLLIFSPLILFFIIEFQIMFFSLLLVIFVLFLVGEIGFLATHMLYCLRKLFAQPRSGHRVLQLMFYLSILVGAFLLFTPVIQIGNTWVQLPLFALANLIVGVSTQGQLALFSPAIIQISILSIFSIFVIIFFSSMWLTNHIGFDLYEEIATLTQEQGASVGLLSRLPFKFQKAKTPFRSFLKKDIITGLRRPGKTFYWVGILTNYSIALLLFVFSPNLRFLLPLSGEIGVLTPAIYGYLLVLLVPLLSIMASNPFESEHSSLHILCSAPITPFRLTLIKFFFALVTPTLLAGPVAIYFAMILGDLSLLFIALAILPHALLLSTAINLGLSSRYPYTVRIKTQASVALLVTYPVVSWLTIAPIALIVLVSLANGIPSMLLQTPVLGPYTFLITLTMLFLTSQSFLIQE